MSGIILIIEKENGEQIELNCSMTFHFITDERKGISSSFYGCPENLKYTLDNGIKEEIKNGTVSYSSESSEDEIIKDFKALESEYNNKRKELLIKYPDIELVVRPMTHRFFVGEKGWGAISLNGYNKRTSNQVF